MKPIGWYPRVIVMARRDMKSPVLPPRTNLNFISLLDSTCVFQFRKRSSVVESRLGDGRSTHTHKFHHRKTGPVCWLRRPKMGAMNPQGWGQHAASNFSDKSSRMSRQRSTERKRASPRKSRNPRLAISVGDVTGNFRWRLQTDATPPPRRRSRP